MFQSMKHRKWKDGSKIGRQKMHRSMAVWNWDGSTKKQFVPCWKRFKLAYALLLDVAVEMPNPAPDPTDSWKVKRKRPSRNGLSRDRPQCQQRDGPTEDRKKAPISATVMFVGDFWPWNPRIRSMCTGVLALQVDSLTIGSVAAFFADELCWHKQTHKIFRSPRRFSRRFILFRFRHSLGKSVPYQQTIWNIAVLVVLGVTRSNFGWSQHLTWVQCLF